jgi:glyceraldehyde 3-phosphate dehydrogenase
VGNLILKDTTAGEATLKVLPELQGKIEAISFRVPTNNVSASDFAINLSSKSTLNEIFEVFSEASVRFPEVIMLNRDSLVSSDFTGISQSCVIDFTKAKLLNGNFLKIVSWYDNEWAYSSRVLDVVNLVSQAS